MVTHEAESPVLERPSCDADCPVGLAVVGAITKSIIVSWVFSMGVLVGFVLQIETDRGRYITLPDRSEIVCGYTRSDTRGYYGDLEITGCDSLDTENRGVPALRQEVESS